MGKIKFDCYDLGGHRDAREIWREYYVDASAIVFMVDSNDRGRFPEAKIELNSLLTCTELMNVPIVVLGNKVDEPTAASETELRHALGLVHTTGNHGQLDNTIRPIELFMCSLVAHMGFADGIGWVVQYI